MISWQKNKLTAQKLISFYILILFSILMLCLPSGRIQGITFRNILYGVATLAAAVAYIVLLFQKKVTCRRRLYRIDLCMLAAFVLSLGQICIHVFRGRNDYEVYLLVAISAFVYFLISAPEKGKRELFEPFYLDVLLAASVVIYAGLYARLLWLPELKGPVGLLIQDEGTLSAFLVLGASVAILQYCCNRNRRKDILYLSAAAAGFFLLFLQKDMPGILLISVLFLMIPVLFPSTAELVRRDLLMALLFFFTGSNMALVTNYSKLLKIQIQFDIRNSIYLELAVAVAGAAALSYWERIPKDIPQEWIVLKRLRKLFIFLLKIFGIALAAVFCTGSLEGLEGHIGMRALNVLVNGVKEGMAQTNGTFMQALEEYGVLGFVLTAVGFAVMMTRLVRRYECTAQSAALTAVAGMFMAQSFFYRQQPVTTPVYAVLITFALFQDRKKGGAL